MLVAYDIILMITAFVLSFAGTGASCAVLKKLQVMDHPNARSNHSAPTPRGGGLGFVLPLVGLLVVVQTSWQIVVGFMLLAVVSFTDDLRSLPARYRFVAQLVAVGLALSAHPLRIAPDFLPFWLEGPLIAFAWLWFINLFNFMDGSDGLAASEAVCVALGVALVAAAIPLTPQALVVAAAVLGFLPWNWHRAKIFMGDVGSVPLGFLLGYLLLSLAAMGFPAAAFILPAVFLVDASFTLIKRLLKGERIFEAHSQHCYQRAVRAGLSHDALAREVTAMNLVLLVLAMTSMWYPFESLLVAYLGVAALLFGRFARLKKKGVAA